MARVVGSLSLAYDGSPRNMATQWPYNAVTAYGTKNVVAGTGTRQGGMINITAAGSQLWNNTTFTTIVSGAYSTAYSVFPSAVAGSVLVAAIAEGRTSTGKFLIIQGISEASGAARKEYQCRTIDMAGNLGTTISIPCLSGSKPLATSLCGVIDPATDCAYIAMTENLVSGTTVRVYIAKVDLVANTVTYKNQITVSGYTTLSAPASLYYMNNTCYMIIHGYTGAVNTPAYSGVFALALNATTSAIVWGPTVISVVAGGYTMPRMDYNSKVGVLAGVHTPAGIVSGFTINPSTGSFIYTSTQVGTQVTLAGYANIALKSDPVSGLIHYVVMGSTGTYYCKPGYGTMDIDPNNSAGGAPVGYNTFLNVGLITGSNTYLNSTGMHTPSMDVASNGKIITLAAHDAFNEYTWTGDVTGMVTGEGSSVSNSLWLAMAP